MSQQKPYGEIFRSARPVGTLDLMRDSIRSGASKKHAPEFARNETTFERLSRDGWSRRKINRYLSDVRASQNHY